ncbi:chromosome segregation and condensation protein ScpA [Chloroherpeton thalassium ATCC 35110]|uniref:Segregation and condensation protein A n=1 Tax=Chloroherpeton thalassium (strain ATCC 35110 / GB-78) TaxID=517418 RepID=B3QW82_CHLT3|nr:segregation/condensation protein A [Chloroherpeton thalassium]ACF13195.1 chromosome segregation and condensation protein ScpA [Chloroherpeton thalassium ATCC 35110]
MYRVHLAEFEGPLDLLLFFIKRDELNIYDIPISKITQDFMAYLDAMQSLSLDVVAEFIYMASVLMSIKAKMLLPRPEALDGDPNEFDPRTELVEKLLEYKRFKKMAGEIRILEEHRRQQHERRLFEQIAAPVVDEMNDPTLRPTLFHLILAYKRVLDHMPKKTVHEIRKVPVSIEEQMQFILKKLDKSVQISFFESVADFQDRIILVVTFLAILEMARSRQISIVTKDDYNDFWISRRQADYEK